MDGYTSGHGGRVDITVRLSKSNDVLYLHLDDHFGGGAHVCGRGVLAALCVANAEDVGALLHGFSICCGRGGGTKPFDIVVVANNVAFDTFEFFGCVTHREFASGRDTGRKDVCFGDIWSAVDMFSAIRSGEESGRVRGTGLVQEDEGRLEGSIVSRDGLGCNRDLRRDSSRELVPFTPFVEAFGVFVVLRDGLVLRQPYSRTVVSEHSIVGVDPVDLIGVESNEEEFLRMSSTSLYSSLSGRIVRVRLVIHELQLQVWLHSRSDLKSRASKAISADATSATASTLGSLTTARSLAAAGFEGTAISTATAGIPRHPRFFYEHSSTFCCRHPFLDESANF